MFRRLVPLAALLIACKSETGTGPDPLRPKYYKLTSINDAALPRTIPGGALIEAKLVPYAVGRTIDQRLVNDRTGRGGTGGNTRDTTLLRGQMMDIRVFRIRLEDGTILFPRDSTIVDVEIHDTVFVISRPHPDPSRTQVDSGWVLGRLLTVPTILRNPFSSGLPPVPATLQYEISRDQ